VFKIGEAATNVRSRTPMFLVATLSEPMMSRSIWLKGALVLGLVVAVAAAQETTPRKSPRGRLPAYWNDVVEPEQKDQLYAIQKKYEAQIDELEAQIEALEAKRETEMTALLTPDQKEKLGRVRAFWENEQALKRAKETKAATGAPPASASPATGEAPAPAAPQP
jgi:TolA-binding protein